MRHAKSIAQVKAQDRSRKRRFNPFEVRRKFKKLTSVEINQHFKKFSPRFYQVPILKALQKYKKVVAVMPRRAGKDVLALNYVISQMYQKSGSFFYLFPTRSQGKRVIWQGCLNSGQKFLDFFPQDLVIKSNEADLTVTMINKHNRESTFYIIGSEQYDRLMGSNPKVIVYSEAALQDPKAYQYLSPITAAQKDARELWISTPRGHNHFYHLCQIAKNDPNWFYYHLTVEDTRHIDLDTIAQEKASGIISTELAEQEYWCSFERGITGSFFGSYIQKARDQDRIGVVPWEEHFPVSTFWDIGMKDATVILFVQVIGQVVRVIDCYSNSKRGLEHYVDIINSKPYRYGKHVAPHDIKAKEWGDATTRLEKARKMGINFTVGRKVSLYDGIEAARSLFCKTWFDEKKCKDLIRALENYRQQYDEKNKCYKSKPYHDWSSDYADAFRYLAVSLSLAQEDANAKERLHDRYCNSVLGVNNQHDPFFKDHVKLGRYSY